MKTTYLIYKQDSEARHLVTASQEEWDTILKQNRGLPPEKRRFFIKDCFFDGNELDCMFIEATREEYRAWHNKVRTTQRNVKAGKPFSIRSADAVLKHADVVSLHECIADESVDVQAKCISDLFMDQLRAALKVWKPWAETVLDIYLSGRKKECNRELMAIFGWTERTAERRKNDFEAYVKKFL